MRTTRNPKAAVSKICHQALMEKQAIAGIEYD
jgi:hypothetical protein